MPEELNRRVVDQLSRFLFIHSPEAHANLVAEGADAASIHFVGNTMIDTLVAMWSRIAAADAPSAHGVARSDYVLVTLHRPALVDTPLLGEAMSALEHLADDYIVLFPVHPRTRAALGAQGFEVTHPRLRLLEPRGYIEFLGLLAGAAAVVTDSGGIQEEATYLRVPCFTLRQSTERPITISVGSNVLLGLEPERLRKLPDLIRAARDRPSGIPELWDGHASGRIVDVLAAELGVAPASGTAAPTSADRSEASVTPIVSSGSGGRASA
jgi:UDP-N-acetylglucosamine 2-epimerase (non-hydrolysing)